MAHESLTNLIYLTISSSRFLNRLAKYLRNKSFISSCPWCKLLIQKRADTYLHIKNATVLRPTQDTSHAVSGIYPDIYCLLQHIIHPCKLSCWISTILRKEILWIAHIVADVYVTSPENNIKGCELVLEEAHYQICLVSQPCGHIRPTSQLLLTFQYFIDCSHGDWYLKRSVGLEILCVCSLPVDSIPVPKHVGVKVIMSCVLWCVLFCFVLYFIQCICWST
jgi:hypothetical protein